MCDTNGNPIGDDPGGTNTELFQKHKRRKTNSMVSEFSTSDSKFLETDTVTSVGQTKCLTKKLSRMREKILQKIFLTFNS